MGDHPSRDARRRAELAAALGWTRVTDAIGTYWADANGDWIAEHQFPIDGRYAPPAVRALLAGDRATTPTTGDAA